MGELFKNMKNIEIIEDGAAEGVLKNLLSSEIFRLGYPVIYCNALYL